MRGTTFFSSSIFNKILIIRILINIYSDSSSSESEEEDKNTQSHVATRQVPGR